MSLFKAILRNLGLSGSRRRRRPYAAPLEPAAMPSLRPLPRRLPSRPKLSSADLWALATGGIDTMLSGDSLNQLKVRRFSNTLKPILAKWWNTTDRASLIRNLQWLLHEGHRHGLVDHIAFLERRLENPAFGTESPLSKLDEFIIQNLDPLKRSRLVAWDLTRLPLLARCGFGCGYLTEAEAWEWIRKAAFALRNQFDSWPETGADFMLGYRYWCLLCDIKRDFSPALVIYQKLMTDPTSPWNTLPWAIDPQTLTGLRLPEQP